MFSVPEAAKSLRVCEATILRLCRSGGIQARKRRGKWVIVRLPLDGGAYTPRGLAESLGVSRRRALAIICGRSADNALQAAKIGRVWRIGSRDGMELIRRQRPAAG